MRRRLFWRGNSAREEDGFKDLASSKNFRELLEGQSAEESEEHFGSVGSRNGQIGLWEAAASPVLVLKFRIGGYAECFGRRASAVCGENFGWGEDEACGGGVAPNYSFFF